MSRIVVDATVALEWCFPDEGGEYAQGVLLRLRESAVLVPAIWPLEVANGILVAERHGRLAAAEVRQFLTLLQGLQVVLDAPDVAHLFAETLNLAKEHGLSSYDGAYLELAMREGLLLATLDVRLKAAAVAAGVFSG